MPSSLRRVVELGRGGMSRVYLVTTDRDDLPRLVVQKVLLATLAQNTEFIDMFFDEARLSARLDHPNVVKIFDVQPEGDEPYMLLEYLDGASLEALVRKSRDSGGMPLVLQLHAIAQAAHGLQYAHELSDSSGNPLSIVHRDVSPHNVFVTFDGAVKVLDFGVAKAADSQHTTKTGTMKGKFTYMAPEQLRDSKRVDHRVDVFALGVMMWQAAMKRRPWTGLSDIEIARSLIKNGLPAVQSTIENPIDDALVKIIQRSTAKAPEDRYPTAGELADDIERYLSRLADKAGPRRLGTWASGVMAERRAKIKKLLDAPPSPADGSVGPISSGSVETSPISSPYSLTPNPPSSRSFSSGMRPVTDTAPPSSGPVSSGPVSGSIHTALFSSSAAPTTPRGTALMALADLGARPSLSEPAAEVRASDVEPRRTPAIPTILAVAAIVLSVIAIAVTGFRSQAASADAASESDVMNLTVHVTPATAKLFLDGVELQGNGSRLRRDSAEHTLRAEAPGYRPAQQKVRSDEASKALTIVLAPTH